MASACQLCMDLLETNHETCRKLMSSSALKRMHHTEQHVIKISSFCLPQTQDWLADLIYDLELTQESDSSGYKNRNRQYWHTGHETRLWRHIYDRPTQNFLERKMTKKQIDSAEQRHWLPWTSFIKLTRLRCPKINLCRLHGPLKHCCYYFI